MSHPDPPLPGPTPYQPCTLNLALWRRLLEFEIRHAKFEIGIIPHSAFVIPHLVDSALRIPHSDDSAFRIRHSAFGRFRIPHSTFHISEGFRIPHSAFYIGEIPHSRKAGRLDRRPGSSLSERLALLSSQNGDAIVTPSSK